MTIGVKSGERLYPWQNGGNFHTPQENPDTDIQELTGRTAILPYVAAKFHPHVVA